MVASYTTSLRLTQQGDNDNPDSWGQVVNLQVIALLEEAVSHVAVVNCTGSSDVNISTSTVNGGTDTARHAVLELTGTLGGNINLIVPAVDKIYLIRAAQTGGFTITVKPTGGSSGISFPSGKIGIVYISGTNIYEISTTGALQGANNLSDLANTTTARANLGVAIGTNVQAYDAGLAALAAFNTNGFLAQTSNDTFAGRTITSTSLTVTNGNGVSGNPTIEAPAASATASGIVELATDAEVQTGTDTARAVTPAGLKAALGFTKYYESTQQTMTSDVVITLTHGLGGVPKWAMFEYVCVTADGDYSVGDVVPVWSFGAANSGSRAAGYNATQIFYRPSTSSFIGDKNSSVLSPNLSRWKLVAKAWI